MENITISTVKLDPEQKEADIMSNKDLRAISVFGGICTIAAAVADAFNSKKWREVHTAAVIGGTVATAIGVFA